MVAKGSRPFVGRVHPDNTQDAVSWACRRSLAYGSVNPSGAGHAFYVAVASGSPESVHVCGGHEPPEGEQAMDGSLLNQVEALRAAPIETIRQKYRELFGEEPRSRNRHSLVRRIAWRWQANAEGGLSERARQRALEIANDADVRVLPPRRAADSQFDRQRGRGRFDRRIPPAGTVLSRDYR